MRKDDASSPSRGRETTRAIAGPRAGRRVGGSVRRAAGGARCRDHLRSRRRARPEALARSRKGGTVVCAGIHMSDVPSFPYELLWGERASAVGREPHPERRPRALRGSARAPGEDGRRRFPLAEAEPALDRLRAGGIRGAAVLSVGRLSSPPPAARTPRAGSCRDEPAPAPRATSLRLYRTSNPRGCRWPRRNQRVRLPT